MKTCGKCRWLRRDVKISGGVRPFVCSPERIPAVFWKKLADERQGWMCDEQDATECESYEPKEADDDAEAV